MATTAEKIKEAAKQKAAAADTPPAKAAPKKGNAAPAAEGEVEKKKVVRRKPSEVLERAEAHLAEMQAKHRAKEQRLIEQIDKLKNGKKPVVTTNEAAQALAAGRTAEEIMAEAKRLLALAKVAKNVSPEEVEAAKAAQADQDESGEPEGEDGSEDATPAE